MPTQVRNGGAWKDFTPYARISGVWTEVSSIHARNAGTWKEVWAGGIKYTSSSTRTAVNIASDFGFPTEADTYIWINEGDISAGASGTYAVDTGTFPAGSTLFIVNKGYIRGRGGKGGHTSKTRSGKSYVWRYHAGNPGLDALKVQFDCTIDNGQGYIWGGGGGGGASKSGGKSVVYLEGGGGAGDDPGAAGGGPSGYNGSAGTASSGGKGAVFSGTHAGNGGNPGATGTAGNGSYGNAAGGAAGKAIDKNGNTVTITAGNDSTRIKGAVS